MAILRRILLLAFSFATNTSQAQPGFEGYWGHSQIRVRLSTPEIIHTAPLALSPRYFEADTIPPRSSELMNLGAQLSERTKDLARRLEKTAATKRARILEAYIRVSLRHIGGDYEISKAKIFRTGPDEYVIAPYSSDPYDRFPEAVMYDRYERRDLRDRTIGVVIADADPDADLRLLAGNLPKPFALHLELLAGKGISEEEIRAAIKEALHGYPSNDYRYPVIADYLRYNLARRLIGNELQRYASREITLRKEQDLIEARELLEVVRSGSSALHTASLHKIAETELARFRLPDEGQPRLRHLEEAIRLLRLCKEEGDPTAVGSIASIVRSLQQETYVTSLAELSTMPETRTALACYTNLPDIASAQRLSPEYLRSEKEWIERLENLGVRNDAAFIRLAAGLHDAGAKEACERVLALCPPGDGIVHLIRAHYAVAKNDLKAAMAHLEMAETDLRPKSRRHEATISGHFEYGLSNETAMMYGRVLVEQSSLLLQRGDFLGAARRLRLTQLDLFNQEYVQGCLLTNAELKQLADEESPNLRSVFASHGSHGDEEGPMGRREPPFVTFDDHLEGMMRSSARVTLARRLLQEGRAREAIPYWDLETRPSACRYADLMDIAQDTSKPAQMRGRAYWQAGLLLRENSNLWACSAGHQLDGGKFVLRVAMANRDGMKDFGKVGPEEHSRINAARKWTAPRNSFFRYGLAEHCLKASELLQGEQSAYALWYGALALAYIDRQAAEPMRQKLLKEYASTKIGQQALAAKGLPKHVEAPENMK
jgi:hypothetical protein